MILDRQNMFSDSQRICDAGATELSTDVVDLGVARDIGIGEPLFWNVLVEAALTGTGTVLNFKLVTDGDSALGSPTVVVETGNIAKALLVAQYQIRIPVPRYSAWERYLGVQYVGDNTFETTGIVSSWLSMGVQDNKAYPDNITITG